MKNLTMTLGKLQKPKRCKSKICGNVIHSRRMYCDDLCRESARGMLTVKEKKANARAKARLMAKREEEAKWLDDYQFTFNK